MTTFALVHGAWHGAWCWDLLAPELRARGHAAIAVQLPCEEPAAGCSAYAAAITDAVAGVGGEDLVLVGHSLAGLTIPLVAAERPVGRLVFLCALIARPGVSLGEQLDAEPGIFAPGFRGAPARDELGRSCWPDREQAIGAFYADCPRERATWAAARLRAQAGLPSREPCPLTSWPDVPCSSIVCREDTVVDPGWSGRAARERLGTTPIILPGDHSPFLSRPAELADALVAIAIAGDQRAGEASTHAEEHAR